MVLLLSFDKGGVHISVHRIEVRAIHSSDDPSGAGVLSEIRQLGINEVVDVRSTRIFLLQGSEDVLTPKNLNRIASEVLIDPVTESLDRKSVV